MARQFVSLDEIATGRPLARRSDAGRLAVGVDLGTTHSVVACWLDEAVKVLTDDDGRRLIPSVVAYDDDGSVAAGEPARRRMLDRPANVIGSVKRLMGRGHADVRTLAGAAAVESVEPADGGMIRLAVGGRVVTPVEVSAEILRAVKRQSEARLGEPVGAAVITVPAYFDDAARAATRDAAMLAGLDVLRLVSEPTAAALAYGLDRGAEGVFAVYDLGGGTFDVSLLRLEAGVFQVLATSGDAALGGDDFDHAIAQRFLDERAHEGIEDALAAGEVTMALMCGRVAKECLTAQPFGSWSLELGGRRSLHRLDRAAFEKLIDPLIERTVNICGDVLADAGLSPGDLDGVVMVGGSTRIPLVRARVERFFGRPPLDSINPDEVVAVGAALQAAALTGRGTGALLLDVTPLSLGIETMGGLVERVVPRNTPIPVVRAQDFTTGQDGQKAMAIHVVQGERDRVADCRSLARFELTGIPGMAAGAARIRVTFAIDADGLLTVTASELATGAAQKVAVKPTYGLSEADRAEMLRAANAARDADALIREQIEARVDAERLIAAVESAIAIDGDVLTADERRRIDDACAALAAAIANDDAEAIRGLTAALELAGRDLAARRMDRALGAALAGRRLDDFESPDRGLREPVEDDLGHAEDDLRFRRRPDSPGS